MKQATNLANPSPRPETSGQPPEPRPVQRNSTQGVKVAIVTGSLGMGGAELIILNLGRSLRQLGYDVTIVTVTAPGEWFDEIQKSGLRALHISGRESVHPYRHAWRVGRRLRDERFDVVLLTKYNNSERCSQAALNMLPTRVIAIPWIHDSTESCCRMALVNRAAWNVAIGVGVGVARMAAKKSKGKPVLHVPNGLVPPTSELVRSGRAADARPFRLCYVGRLEQSQKGIFSLPAILALCRQRQLAVALDIVGDGSDKDGLVQRFEQAGLSDSVAFHGAVPHDEVFRCFSQAHVALMPSYQEAMPCVPIEAQFCGCVPIVSRLPGITDTIMDDGRTGILVEVDDINGFVAAIGGLVNDRARWQAMSLAGPRRVADFTLEAMGRRFDELIQACLRGEYPLPHSRRSWLPVNPLAMTWREAIPRGIHRLGIGAHMRRLRAKSQHGY